MSCRVHPVLTLVLLIINCCRAWDYWCRWFLHLRWRVAWGSQSAAWDSRNGWDRCLCYGLLVLLLLAVSNSLYWIPLRDVLLGQWPLCVIIWIFTRIQVVMLLSCLELMLWSHCSNPWPCMMRVWYKVHGWGQGFRFGVVQLGYG